jgi:hypothetical protein
VDMRDGGKVAAADANVELVCVAMGNRRHGASSWATSSLPSSLSHIPAPEYRIYRLRVTETSGEPRRT